jgi:hypothetical protein
VSSPPPSYCCLPLPLPSAKAAAAKHIQLVLPVALTPALQLTAVLVSPVSVGRLEVAGGDRRWRHRAAAATVVVVFFFVPATRGRRHVRHTRAIVLDTVVADDDRAQNVFSGQGLAISAGGLERLSIVMHTGYRV